MQSYVHMVNRQSWIDRVESAWRRRSIVWLRGVRRVGKTCLCQSLGGTVYLDCDLPGTLRQTADPEAFWSVLRGERVVLDEVQRLADPARLLKIAADHFPETKVLATGSSTLAATAKFSDSLAGRKAVVWLTPMVEADRAAFGGFLEDRLWWGGLPGFYLGGDSVPDSDYAEWLESYWARDVQELFRLRQRGAFVRFVQLVLARSGGMFEATSFAEACTVSRATVASYLDVLDVTGVAQVVRPFSSRATTEIVSAPKVYGFDTGFVRFASDWRQRRPEDLGRLWEHYVLNELDARLDPLTIRYWRAKKGPEVDFVVPRGERSPVAIECKWRASSVSRVPGIRAFRAKYPGAENYVVCADVERPHRTRASGVDVTVTNLEGLVDALSGDATR